jgi:hypothetical protein
MLAHTHLVSLQKTKEMNQCLRSAVAVGAASALSLTLFSKKRKK